MELNKLHKVYFLGVGGIGMSAIARFFNLRGVEVLGYDRVSTPLTQSLEEEGITIHYDENPDFITDDIDLLVYTPAIPKTHSEWEAVKKLQIPIMKRAAVLGLIASGMKTVAIAGTHSNTFGIEFSNTS